MQYKKTLEKLGLQEAIDFTLTESSFEMVPKTHLVETQLAVYEDDELISEAVVEEQEYTPDAPSQESMDAAWIEVQLDESDIALLVGEYLKDKEELRDVENDSINIVNNRIFGWSFANIARPSNEELVALISTASSKQAQEVINKQIAELEASITPRRLREAVLSGDNSFIEGVEAEIATLRASL